MNADFEQPANIKASITTDDFGTEMKNLESGSPTRSFNEKTGYANRKLSKESRSPRSPKKFAL